MRRKFQKKSRSESANLSSKQYAQRTVLRILHHITTPP